MAAGSFFIIANRESTLTQANRMSAEGFRGFCQRKLASLLYEHGVPRPAEDGPARDWRAAEIYLNSCADYIGQVAENSNLPVSATFHDFECAYGQWIYESLFGHMVIRLLGDTHPLMVKTVELARDVILKEIRLSYTCRDGLDPNLTHMTSTYRLMAHFAKYVIGMAKVYDEQWTPATFAEAHGETLKSLVRALWILYSPRDTEEDFPWPYAEPTGIERIRAYRISSESPVTALEMTQSSLPGDALIN